MGESHRHNIEQKKAGTKDYEVQRQAKLIHGAVSQNNGYLWRGLPGKELIWEAFGCC